MQSSGRSRRRRSYSRKGIAQLRRIGAYANRRSSRAGARCSSSSCAALAERFQNRRRSTVAANVVGSAGIADSGKRPVGALSAQDRMPPSRRTRRVVMAGPALARAVNRSARREARAVVGAPVRARRARFERAETDRSAPAGLLPPNTARDADGADPNLSRGRMANGVRRSRSKFQGTAFTRSLKLRRRRTRPTRGDWLAAWCQHWSPRCEHYRSAVN